MLNIFFQAKFKTRMYQNSALYKKTGKKNTTLSEQFQNQIEKSQK
jgi:hypothetical protein